MTYTTSMTMNKALKKKYLLRVDEYYQEALIHNKVNFLTTITNEVIPSVFFYI